jgi:Protein of unknown function (DUF2804)
MRHPRGLVYRRRPLKRWTWVGAFGEEAIVCAARAWVAGVPASWWCVLDRRTGAAVEGRGGVTVSPSALRVRGRASLEVAGGAPIEVRSPHGRAWAWTRKTGGGRARGWVALGGERVALDAGAIVDESAGYHARHTAWHWSAGAGVARSGAAVAWNLVAGLHDAEGASERRVWVDGVAHEVGPVAFAGDLGSLALEDGRLECAREHVLRQRRNLLVVRSDLEQRFGAVSGTLPVAGELARAWGVVERHDVLW